MEIEEVIKGNCLEVMKDIPDGSIDMILCDLPYGSSKCSWDIVILFDSLWEQYERIVKENGAILLTGKELFASLLRLSNTKLYRYDWYWQKTKVPNFQHKKKMPGFEIETISVFYKKLPTYNYEKIKSKTGYKAGQRKGVKYDVTDTHKKVTGNNSNLKYADDYEYGMVLPNNLLKFSNYKKPSENWHPTQKPVALFEYLIKTYTNENDLVLDNAAGSMTTAIAALNTNRNYICIEKEDEYYQKGLERIKKHKEEMKNE